MKRIVGHHAWDITIATHSNEILIVTIAVVVVMSH